MTFTAGSLFSGIGGIDVAFAAAGFDIRFQVEIDDYCRKVLSKHAPRYWPNAAQHVDIRDVGRAELGTVDVLFGGFPCQDISVAGNGAGLEGARSGLWYEMRRIIGDIRPRVVFIENVPAITSRGGTTVIAHLTEMGYDARWGIVGAADAGAPHGRRRWFCVAYDMCGRPDEQTALADSETNRVGDIPPYSAQWGAIADAAFAGRETVSDAAGPRLEGTDERRSQFSQPSGCHNSHMGNTESAGFAALQSCGYVEAKSSAAHSGRMGHAQRSRRAATQSIDEVCGEPRTPTDRDDSNQHLPKSGLGRNANGVPAWLHEFRGGINDQQMGSEESGTAHVPDTGTLRAMRDDRGTIGAAPRGLSEADRCDDSLPGLPLETGTRERTTQGEDAKDMPDMRIEFYSLHAYAQSDMQQGVPERVRQTERIQAVEDWIINPRFPAGSNQPQHAWEPPRQIVQRGADWQGRIKALGNAVVPAVVYPFAVEIMRQLAEAESHGD